MALRELQEQALELSVEERWQLAKALIQSLQSNSQLAVKPKGLAASLISMAKTDAPPPTDEEVKATLDERLVQNISVTRILFDTNVLLDALLVGERSYFATTRIAYLSIGYV